MSLIMEPKIMEESRKLMRKLLLQQIIGLCHN